MNAVSKILLKSIVIPFYRSHAGLLIFVFLVMFGTVESRYLVHYHETLIQGMFNSEIFLIVVCMVWVLYSFKILLFILSLLKKPEYGFLNNLALIAKPKAYGQILMMVIHCFSPVLLYSVFIYLIGISQHYYTTTLGIFIFQIILCCTNASVLVFFLQTQHRFTWSFATFRMPNVGGRIGFYISHILHEEKIALLISKTFSLGLLYIVREATTAGDDFRILGLTWVFVLLAHTFLMLKIKMFEDRHLTWVNSLPITTIKTCLLYFILFTGLLLPELIFSISMMGNFYEPVLLAMLSGGLLMFIQAYLLKPDREPDQYSTFLFWLFMLTFFAILSNLMTILIIVLIAMACIRITKRYYQYEPVID